MILVGGGGAYKYELDCPFMSPVVSHDASHVMTPVVSHVMSPVASHVMSPVASPVASQGTLSFINVP